MSSSADWESGALVRVKGLVKAAQHNGKIGKISSKPAENERIGVELGKGQVLAVRRENLEPVSAEVAAAEAAAEAAASDAVASMAKQRAEAEAAASAAVASMGKQRTLSRNNSMLEEFNGSRDPDVLALYFHYADRQFDCFNASEYITQMVRYLSADLGYVACLPRRMRGNDYMLVCLQHKETDKNTLCEVAFNCGRSFTGISMLVKRRCFACNRPGAPLSACTCACFCSAECEASDIGRLYKANLCKLARAYKVVPEEECVELMS